MDDYIAAKLIWSIGLVCAIFFGGIVYGLITGRDIRDLFREKPSNDKPGQRRLP